MVARSRTPEILADAAHVVLTKPASEFSGHFLLDEDVLRAEGVTEFDGYANDPAHSHELIHDFFV
jgi:citronellol/citronellal dehydrogenase